MGTGTQTGMDTETGTGRGTETGVGTETEGGWEQGCLQWGALQGRALEDDQAPGPTALEDHLQVVVLLRVGHVAKHHRELRRHVALVVDLHLFDPELDADAHGGDLGGEWGIRGRLGVDLVVQ